MFSVKGLLLLLLLLLLFFFFFLGGGGGFSNGLTTADLKTDGKLPVERESLITEVNDGRRSSMSSASHGDGRGSSSHVLMTVLFNTSRTIDSDTGWKAVSGDSSKTVSDGR